jgi:hypothetical protein
MSEATAEGGEPEDERTYSGLVSAFPYAVRRSDSWLFKSYAVAGGLVAGVVALLFVLALVVLIAATTGGPGGSLTVSRAFFIVTGLFVVAPLCAPVLLVARRHRRAHATQGYDAALALAGYCLLASLYVGLVISVPSEQQAAPTGLLAPVVEVLYGLPALAGILPPALAVCVIALVHRTAD